MKELTYFEGKRMKGKGEEYIKEKLIYKGSYSDGKRWKGKGKEFDINGKFVLENM